MERKTIPIQNSQTKEGDDKGVSDYSITLIGTELRSNNRSSETPVTVRGDVPSGGKKRQSIHRAKKAPYMVYQILVAQGEDSWIVLRRYSQFRTLNEKLRSKYPMLMKDQSKKLPGKKLRNNLSPVRVDKRMIKLQQYLTTLLKIEQIHHSYELKVFLETSKLPVEEYASALESFNEALKHMDSTDQFQEAGSHTPAAPETTDGEKKSSELRHSGWLYKYHNGSWKRRYFQLRSNVLHKYSSETDTHPIGRYDLTNSEVWIGGGGKLKAGKSKFARQREKLCFGVAQGESSSNDRFFSAESQKDLEDWVEAIRGQILSSSTELPPTSMSAVPVPHIDNTGVDIGGPVSPGRSRMLRPTALIGNITHLLDTAKIPDVRKRGKTKSTRGISEDGGPNGGLDDEEEDSTDPLLTSLSNTSSSVPFLRSKSSTSIDAFSSDLPSVKPLSDSHDRISSKRSSTYVKDSRPSFSSPGGATRDTRTIRFTHRLLDKMEQEESARKAHNANGRRKVDNFATLQLEVFQYSTEHIVADAETAAAGTHTKPEPLVSHALNMSFLAVERIGDLQVRLKLTKTLLQLVPRENFNAIARLMAFLYEESINMATLIEERKGGSGAGGVEGFSRASAKLGDLFGRHIVFSTEVNGVAVEKEWSEKAVKVMGKLMIEYSSEIFGSSAAALAVTAPTPRYSRQSQRLTRSRSELSVGKSNTQNDTETATAPSEEQEQEEDENDEEQVASTEIQEMKEVSERELVKLQEKKKLMEGLEVIARHQRKHELQQQRLVQRVEAVVAVTATATEDTAVVQTSPPAASRLSPPSKERVRIGAPYLSVSAETSPQSSLSSSPVPESTFEDEATKEAPPMPKGDKPMLKPRDEVMRKTRRTAGQWTFSVDMGEIMQMAAREERNRGNVKFGEQRAGDQMAEAEELPAVPKIVYGAEEEQSDSEVSDEYISCDEGWDEDIRPETTEEEEEECSSEEIIDGEIEMSFIKERRGARREVAGSV